jgi:hypothetical protein
MLRRIALIAVIMLSGCATPTDRPPPVEYAK